MFILNVKKKIANKNKNHLQIMKIYNRTKHA